MAKGYPEELRLQVVAYMNEGHSVREAAAKFNVSPSFAAKQHKKHADGAGKLPLLEEKAAPEPEKPSLDAEVTASELADFLKVSKRSVSDFVERGIVVKTDRNRFDLRRSVQSYCEHIRMAAAGRGGDSADVLTVERARLAREQADQTAMKNAAMRGEYVAKTDIRHEWASIGRRIRNAMMSVPSRCRQMLPHLTTYDVDLIDHEIRSALTGLGDEDDDNGAGNITAGGVGKPATASEAEALAVD